MDPSRLPNYRPDAPGAVLDGEEWARNWGTFLQAVNDPDDASARVTIRNAMSERVPSEGGFLLPESLRAQVVAYVTPPIVRPRAMVVPMETYRVALPVIDNPSQASGGGVLGGLTFSFTETGAAITASNPSFGREVLEARKLAALLAVPNELPDDAADAFGDFLSRVIGIGMAWTEDDYFIGAAGTGAGVPQSVMNAPCAVRITRTNSAAAPVLADIAAMANALHPASLQAGFTPGVTDVAWLLSTSTFSALLQLYLGIGTAPAGADVSPSNWLSLGDGHDVGPSMLGLPAFVTDHQPAVGSTGDVILADLRHYAIGDRLALTVERSKAGPGFPADVSDFRVKSRLDGRYTIQSATTTEASQPASPVVVLK